MSDTFHTIILEEYKTLRQELLEIDQRINNLVVYSVVSTATIFGFALNFPSPFMFLLPIIVLFTLGYKIKSLQNTKVHIGTFISTEIESKLDNHLQWETYNVGRRVEASKNKKFFRQLPNYLIFDLLAGVCVIASIFYAVTTDENISSFIYELLSLPGNAFFAMVVLVILWVGIFFVFFKWTLSMRDCFSDELQNVFKERINKILHSPKENKD